MHSLCIESCAELSRYASSFRTHRNRIEMRGHPTQDPCIPLDLIFIFKHARAHPNRIEVSVEVNRPCQRVQSYQCQSLDWSAYLLFTSLLFLFHSKNKYPYSTDALRQLLYVESRITTFQRRFFLHPDFF